MICFKVTFNLSSHYLFEKWKDNGDQSNEEQIINGYPFDGAIGSSGGRRIWKLLMVCLHNNAIVARGTLATILHCRTPEPRLNAIHIVNSVGTLFDFMIIIKQ